METKINQLKEEVNQLKIDHQKLVDRLDISECLSLSFDISRLFIFYHINPLLKQINKYKKNYSTWTLFKNRLTVIKRNINEGKQSRTALANFVRPLQTELMKFNINVIRLHDLIQKRNYMTHRDIRLAIDQRVFLDSVGEYEFSTKFEYVDVVTTMINKLKTTKLKDMKTD